MGIIPHELDLADMEQTSLLRMILYLSIKGRASMTDMKRDIKASQDSLYRARDKLIKHKLIKKGLPKGSARKIDYWLTDKGKKLVPLILATTKILSNTT